MNLSRSPADIVRYWLCNATLLGTLPTLGQSWPIYTNHEPNDPDNCITLYDFEGSLQGRTHNNGETQEAYGIQVRVRSSTNGYLTARNKINNIDSAFDSLAVASVSILQDVGSVYDQFVIQGLTRRSSVLYLGVEPNSKCPLFTCNFVATIRQKG